MLPGKLKTVEIDTEKKIYRINDIDFSKTQMLSLLCIPSATFVCIDKDGKTEMKAYRCYEDDETLSERNNLFQKFFIHEKKKTAKYKALLICSLVCNFVVIISIIRALLL